MAPAYASYSTAVDVESLLRSNAPSRRSMAWPICIATLLGMVCGVSLALHGNTATTLPVQPQSSSTVSAQKAAPMRVVDSRSLVQKVGNGLAALSLASMANLATPVMVPASELDVLSSPTPTSSYIYDDGKLLSKAATGELEAKLPEIEKQTGYRINVITLRKLVNFEDAFQFADNLIERWYPTAELGDKKAIFVIVKNSKEGGLVGGPSFSENVPGEVLESIFNDNLGKLLPEEKFNQAVQSSVNRLGAVLAGQPDPGAPKLLFAKGDKPQQSSNYKTKEETDDKRSVYVTVFGALVVISFVAPMVQFFGYTKDDS